jgi:predicted CopG family antitoxin
MPKTIQIDQDAYERLETTRRPEETVSEVIKRCVRPVRSAEQVLDELRKANLSDDTLEAIGESVARRRRTPRRRSI